MRIAFLVPALMVVAVGACSGATPATAPPATAAATAPPVTVAVGTPTAQPGGAATPALTGPFTAAGVAHYGDPAATAVNPADFETKVPSSSGAVYVVFALKPGTVGKVTLTMTKGGQAAVAPLSLDYKSSDTWGDFQVNFPSGDRTGDYVATITFVSTGDSVALPFTVG